MTPQEAIKMSIEMAEFVCGGYLADLTDAELMKRPAPGCNHINWQLGHLIASEHQMTEKIAPGSMPPLPAGFAEKYAPGTSTSDDPAQFAKKDELLAIAKAQRAGTLAALAKTSTADLDKPTGVEYAKTVGAMFALQGSHWLMHAGQWVVVRRQSGRPPLF